MDSNLGPWSFDNLETSWHRLWHYLHVHCNTQQVLTSFIIIIIMPNCTDMSIPIENVHCLGHFLLFSILMFFPYRTLLLHSAFSMSKGTVATDTTRRLGSIVLMPAVLVQYVP